MSLIAGHLMANDTDLLSSNDSGVSSSDRNGEIDKRQASLHNLEMSGAHNIAPVGSSVASGEKLDSYVANGCVKLLEGTLECDDVTESVVCSNNNATATCDDVKLTRNAVFVDSQHSTANGLVSATVDKWTGNTDVHCQQSSAISQNYPTTATDHASPEILCETFLGESAQTLAVDDSNKQLASDESCSSALSLQQLVLTPGLSDLSIVDEDSGNPSVPCADSVGTQSDTTIRYIVYESERQMESIMQLITKDLSEPYSIYTYRYFIHNWPKLCFLVRISEFVCFLCNFTITYMRHISD